MKVKMSTYARSWLSQSQLEDKNVLQSFVSYSINFALACSAITASSPREVNSKTV